MFWSWIAITIDLKYRNRFCINHFCEKNEHYYFKWDLQYNIHFCTLAHARHICVITRCKSTTILLAMRFKRYRLLLRILWCLKILWLGVIHLRDLMMSLFKHFKIVWTILDCIIIKIAFASYIELIFINIIYMYMYSINICIP